MKVLIDAEKIRNPNTGLGVYWSHLGRALAAQRPEDMEMGFVVPPDARGAFGDGVSYVADSWWRRVRGPGACDVWHAGHQDSPYPFPRGAKTILSIMDLNFLERSDYSLAKKMKRMDRLRRRAERASAIVTISNASADSIREHLRTNDLPIHVIYPGNSMLEPPTEPSSAPAGVERLDKPFLLFIGAIHPRKNILSLVGMMKELPDLALVVAGPGGGSYGESLRAAIVAARLEDRVARIGAVSDAERRWLYEECRALVFPSLSEGFGMPAVEAMAFGKPVFLSRLTSLPEVGGDVAFYFPSFDGAAMAEVIHDGLAAAESDSLHAVRSRDRSTRFTWERSAAEHGSIYHGLE